MFATYHANPYIHGPSVIQIDRIYSTSVRIGSPRRRSTAPVHTSSAASSRSASIAASEFAFKLIAALASAGTTYFIWRCAKLRGLNPVRSIALFGLNPLVTLYGVGGGHNDLLMLLLTVGASTRS